MLRFRLILAAFVGGLTTNAAVPAPPQEPAVPYWKPVPDAGTVAAATCVGGKGHEWLVGGGFASSGAVILVGNVAGPQLDLPVPVQVLGKDGELPPEAKRVPRMAGKAQRVDKAGNPEFEKPSWRQPDVTGFILRCSADLKKIEVAARLPWTGGTLTAVVVGPDDAVYVAGKATDRTAGVAKDSAEYEPAGKAEKGKCSHTFLARLKPDLSAVEWVRLARGESSVPQLELLADGNVRISAQDASTFDRTGKRVASRKLPYGGGRTTSISPVDGSVAVGGEHHSPTGRQPWRCPTLDVYKPDGTLGVKLYDWGGPFVGLDNIQGISDSAVRGLVHEPDGSILFHAWSDGGNSVMTAQPYDVRRSVGMNGLEMSAAGVTVLSLGYLVRLDPGDYRVTAWSLFAAQGKKGTDSAFIDDMRLAKDGSVLLAGRSAWGLRQTKPRLSDSPPANQFVTIVDRSLGAVRFSASVPATGFADVGFVNQGWASASGVVAGKQKVLFVGSATKEEEIEGRKWTPATQNGLQAGFGGGWCDGYAILIDLPLQAPAAKRNPPPAPVSGPTSISFERAGGGRVVGQSSKAPTRTVAPGAKFTFLPTVPKHVTVDAEFRDRAGKLWPSFFYGRPAEGAVVFPEPDRPQAAVTVSCPNAAQPEGDQSKRVLGSLFMAGKPPTVNFTLSELGLQKTIEVKDTDSRGKEITRVTTYYDGKGVLAVGDRKIAVTPRVTVRPKGGETKSAKPGDVVTATSVNVAAFFTLPAKDLGLAPDVGDVDVRVQFQGQLPKVPPAGTGK